MTDSKHLSLFQGYGVEIEYILVDKTTLSALPLAGTLLTKTTGKDGATDAYFSKTAWSNELVQHLLEIKSNGPCRDLTLLPAFFQNDIKKINGLLGEYNAQLLPTGAHPWLDPKRETHLWCGEGKDIYEKFHTIFNCYNHGWANLQSVHLNLPFVNDEEFARLHTAVRLLLPIIPALSASSPLLEGKVTGFVDSRLEVYRHNQQKIPSISGKIIPEAIKTQQEYQEKILNKIYQDIIPYDPDGILQEEWLNSRGAIARFERNTVEIRVIDTQECPLADCAILYLVVAVLKQLVAEQWCDFTTQFSWEEDKLAKIFVDVVKSGQAAVIDDTEYLRSFGLKQDYCTARDLWLHIFNVIMLRDQITFAPFSQVINTILTQGNLSERILQNLQREKFNLPKIYGELARCLQEGRIYIPFGSIGANLRV